MNKTSHSRTFLNLLAALGLSLLFPIAESRSDSAEDALKHFTSGVQTFDAHFAQVQSNDKGQVTAQSSGHFWLARPIAGNSAGKFRWSYEKPYVQTTVCDGAKLWSYDPDLNQVTVRNAKTALAGTPAELLSQKAALNDAFTVKDGGAQGDTRQVTLLPKSKDSDFQSIELTLNAEGAPVRMRFADQIGGISEVTFSDVHTNAKIDPAQFQFTPPKGAELVNDGGITSKSVD